MNPEPIHHVLIIDDTRAIHDDFRKILNAPSQPVINPAEREVEAALFGQSPPAPMVRRFEIDSAYQGAEGLAQVQQALANGRPYALAFVDVRMPPGWDGLETTARIWAAYPDLQIVLCTACAEYTWDEIVAKVGQSDRLVILKKPFDNIEVRQLAYALTEKWRLLQRSKEKLQDLEQMVAERTAELRESEARFRRIAEHEHELHRIKSRFVTMVSHEFRTPLGVINTAAHLLGRYAERMALEERAGQLREIQRAVERMTQMMEDLLCHEQCATGNMECRPSRVDLAALCRQLIAEVSNHCGTPCVVECTIGPGAQEAFLDEKILRHILGNLLSNAVKYSLEGRPVSLELARVAGPARPPGEPATPTGDLLRLKVSDSGIGIPATDLSRLYQAFHRASNVGQRPGTGMGLAVVKQCVDLHRGTIRVESQEEKGTTVWVELPIPVLDGKAVAAEPSAN